MSDKAAGLLLIALALCGIAVAQAPPGLLRFSATPNVPQVGDCLSIQSLTSSGVTVQDSGAGHCVAGGISTYSKQTPTTGFSITFPNQTAVLVLAPAATLATGTITMPAIPADGQQACVSSSQTISSLTVNANAGQSIIAAPTAMSAGGFCYLYNASATTWFRLY